jgi:hypothetical protein
LANDALLTALHPPLENVLQTVCQKLQEDSGTGGFDLSPLPPLENSSSSHCIFSIGLMDELQGFRIQSRNADAPLRKYPVDPPILKTVLLKRPHLKL